MPRDSLATIYAVEAERQAGVLRVLYGAHVPVELAEAVELLRQTATALRAIDAAMPEPVLPQVPDFGMVGASEPVPA